MRRRVCWIALCLAFAPVGSQAETFLLRDGVVIEGTVVRSVGNALSIKLDRAGLHQVPLGMVDRLEISTADGERVSGNLAWWKDGIYVLVTDQGLVEVKDGIVSSVTGDVSIPNADNLAIPVDADQAVDQDAGVSAQSTRSLAAEPPPQKLEPTM